MFSIREPFVSVIIPVYNDSDRLKTCLRALENQTYPQEHYEVIVVDNNSDVKPEITVEEYPHLVFTEEKIPGPSSARNRGIFVSRGSIIAFTDSDCIPASDWIEKGVINLLDNPSCGLIGGRIQLFFKDDENPTAVEIWESIFSHQQQIFIEERKFAATGNLFTFKKVLDKVGAFNSKLSFAASEDRELGNRIYNSGYELLYRRDVIVKHPSKNTVNELFNKQLRYYMGRKQLQKMNNESNNLEILALLRDLCPPIFSIKRIIENENFKKLKGAKVKMKVFGVFLAIRFKFIKYHINNILFNTTES